MVIYMEKAFLVGVCVGDDPLFQHSMEELQALTTACNFEVVGQITQNLPAINNALYLGSGKLEELRDCLAIADADLLIFDNALTPTQLRNLQKELSLPILDRTSLILEIFASRAKSREAKLQVELAKLQYMLPRLVGLHDSLGRQGGASGAMSNKGAGEKKLELDRRHIEHQISECRKNLKEISRDRDTQRKLRNQSTIPQVALVGYTNAGKSTVLNALLSYFGQNDEKKVLEKDMLFATLDTMVRRISPPDHRDFFLSDTVGFIDRLPHQLVEAFHSTLEEAATADLLLMVIDFSDPACKEHIRVTSDVLRELGAGDIPIRYLYNKVDLSEKPIQPPYQHEDKFYFSAKNPAHIEALVSYICDTLYPSQTEVTFLIPYTDGGKVSYLQEHTKLLAQEYLPEGVKITVSCTKELAERFRSYLVC